MLRELWSGLPWYVHLGFASAICWLLIKLFLIWRANSPEKLKEYDEARELARRFATQDYFVQDAQGIFGATSLKLKTADALRLDYLLDVWAKHPDIEACRQLQRFDRVGFVYSERPISRLGRGEICAYLRLKQ